MCCGCSCAVVAAASVVGLLSISLALAVVSELLGKVSLSFTQPWFESLLNHEAFVARPSAISILSLCPYASSISCRTL